MAEDIVAGELTVDVLRGHLFYNSETGEFKRRCTRGRWKAGTLIGSVSKSTGYVTIWICGRLHFAHRLAWLYVYGGWPLGVIDHINRCKTDNRIANLRSVDFSASSRNQGMRSDNTSGARGVNWYEARGCWRARAFINRKEIWLGDFPNISDAIFARKAWEIKNPIESIENDLLTC